MNTIKNKYLMCLGVALCVGLASASPIKGSIVDPTPVRAYSQVDPIEKVEQDSSVIVSRYVGSVVSNQSSESQTGSVVGMVRDISRWGRLRLYGEEEMLNWAKGVNVGYVFEWGGVKYQVVGKESRQGSDAVASRDSFWSGDLFLKVDGMVTFGTIGAFSENSMEWIVLGILPVYS